MAITPGNSTSASGATVTKPTGAATGDTVVVAVSSGNSGTGTTIPGFVNRIELTGLAYTVAILTRVLDGSEGASWTASNSGTTVLGNGALILTPGAGNTLAIDGTPTSNSAGNGSTATIPAITTTVANTMLIAGFVSSATGHTTPSGMTEVFDISGGSGVGLSLDYQAIAAAGSTGTRASTTGGIRMVGVMLALKETTASTPATVNAVTATATAAMRVPTVTAAATIAAPLLTATAAMRVPTVTAAATIAAPLLTATAAMLVPSVAVTVSVAPPVLTATAQMYAPTVTAAANVAAPLLTATALMPAPAVGVPNGVTAPVLTATGQLLAPAITAEATIAAPVLTATAAMQTPSVSIDVIVSPLTLTATAQMPTPTVTAAASISAPLLTATAAFLTPVVTGEVWIDAPLLTASAELLAPSVIAEAVVGDVPVLTSAAEMPIPFVGVAPPTTPWAGGQMQPGTQRGVRGSVSARAGVTGTVRQRAGVTMKETP